ncbi:SIS domain-containing protein [Streptomyces sp. PTY087I2]|uniref:SIS domain-containing protein n=1 Tax=Streptomyces sp. PTY087I2 TaxID=1819298 RepID=UPI00080BFE24|nr:sugar isomerase [Streptomyces sp. PTY087I2]OCC11892.1 Glutamine--fructose-6-phosphate aminotransferase [Streptomyces sp. PTY087I2]
MSYAETETASQPACWRRAAALAGGPEAAALPVAGERVAVVGCGTSFYMAQAYAGLREGSGQGESDAFAASEFPSGRGYDRVVALTRSGTTTEVLELLNRLRGTTRTVAVTADPRTPVKTAADALVVLDFADERSVVQTRFATTALTLLRAHLGLHSDTVVTDAEAALAEPLPDELLRSTQFSFLGRGWTVGLAHEAALKMKEASLSWTESYPAMEYRHGPISISTTGTTTWMFGEAPEGLAEQVRATGARWVNGSLDPLADLVRVQRLALARAAARGLDPDLPRHLSRSVVLDGA